MKRRMYVPLLVLLLVSMACTLGDVNPLKENLVTPTAMPTNTPVPKENTESSLYDDFVMEDPAWSETIAVTTAALPGAMISSVSTLAGMMKFDIQDAETYLYKFYKNPSKADVVVETKAQAVGSKIDGIALVCRARNDYTAWYEFRVTDEGRYSIYRYDKSLKDADKNPYIELEKGALRKDYFAAYKENVIRATCQGNSLSLEVNGNAVVSVIDGALPDAGLVGMGAMSYDTLPVAVEFDYLSYGQP